MPLLIDGSGVEGPVQLVSQVDTKVPQVEEPQLQIEVLLPLLEMEVISLLQV